MTAPDLAHLKRKILRDRGLDCNRFKENFFLRRVEARMRHAGQADLAAYGRLLERDPEEYERLFDALSINVTAFFRDQPVFRVLRDRVLPVLLAEKAASRSRTLRVWSAGCAAGQEAYSVAILVADALKTSGADLMARVYGTDVDAEALAQARRGVYESSEMEGVAGAYSLRHFVANGRYRVSPDVRGLVRFKVHDLAKDPPLRHVDLLLCRYVLIYFAKEAQERLCDIFYSALRPAGFLVVGKTEAIGGTLRSRFLTFDAAERVYRKPPDTSVAKGGHRPWP